MPCHGRGVLLRCVSTNRVVTTAIEKERKGSIEVGQIEHIGNDELRRNPGGGSALFRLLHCQRRYVDASHLEALLREPDTSDSRSTTQFERATGLHCVPTQDTLQLRGRPTRVPRQITVAVAIIPFVEFCHDLCR
jgi:hypothetical protein